MVSVGVGGGVTGTPDGDGGGALVAGAAVTEIEGSGENVASDAGLGVAEGPALRVLGRVSRMRRPKAIRATTAAVRKMAS